MIVDANTTQSGGAFSTWDQDHDGRDNVSCSQMHSNGGWWFRGSYCGGANLNGAWAAGGSRGLLWVPVTGEDSATSSRVMVGH